MPSTLPWVNEISPMPSILSCINKISTQIRIHERVAGELGTLSTVFKTARTHHSLEAEGTEAHFQTPDHRVQKLDHHRRFVPSSESRELSRC